MHHGSLKTGCADANLVRPNRERGNQITAHVVGLSVPLDARALILYNYLGVRDRRTKGICNGAFEDGGGLSEREISQSKREQHEAEKADAQSTERPILNNFHNAFLLKLKEKNNPMKVSNFPPVPWCWLGEKRLGTARNEI